MKNIRVLAAFAAGLVTALGVGVAIGAQGESSQGGGQKAAFAAMNGSKEVGNDGQGNAGDRNGRGSFAGVIDGNKLCYGLNVANIGKPIAAHIHKAPSGENGDVVLTLKHPKTGDPGASSECVQISNSLAGDIRENPKGFYVNVHNEAFPSGAIRGQIFLRG